MLTFRRPAGSPTERNFISTWIRPLGVEQDPKGNLYKRIGDAPVLWSCHTDTVSAKGGMQRITYVDDFCWTNEKSSDCLGADDTAGVWLCREMILANRPGLYVFHRAEECGGNGSVYIANHTPELLDGIQMAIAFDRRGDDSIITHQFGGRCCSDSFAISLAAGLGMDHKPDSGGSFTDTANYSEIVPECSNVSVGYYHEHSPKEFLDTGYLIELRDRLLELDTRDLVVARDPKTVEDLYSKYYGHSKHYGYIDYDRDWRSNVEVRPKHTPSMYSIIRDCPDEVADVLESYGISVNQLAEDVISRGGVIY